MSEFLKIASNGQWTLEKGDVISINKPKLDKLTSKEPRQPAMGSPSTYENEPTREGTAKPLKNRVGDPRHLDREKKEGKLTPIKQNKITETTRHGATRDVSPVTGGVSELRPKIASKHSEYERDSAPDRRTGKHEPWNK